MIGRKDFERYLVQLRSARSAERDLAAAEIADLFEANQFDSRMYKKAVAVLIPLALTEKNESAREAMFNALSSAASAEKTWQVDWEPIAARLAEFEPDCLEHAITILAFSGNARYAPRIKRFLDHADEGVRSEAEGALQMLNGRPSKFPIKAK